MHVGLGRAPLGHCAALGHRGTTSGRSGRWATALDLARANDFAGWARRPENEPVSESWMLDELAHAGPEHLDEIFIAGYDRKQGYPDPAEDLGAFQAHGLGASSVIVDLGAGTGQFALPAARRF